jgi:hypothetical protein
MMEAAGTSETLVNFYQTTRCYNPEDSNLHTHRRENLKSYLVRKKNEDVRPEPYILNAKEIDTRKSHERVGLSAYPKIKNKFLHRLFSNPAKGHCTKANVCFGLLFMLRNLSFKVTSKSVIHYVKLSIK